MQQRWGRRSSIACRAGEAFPGAAMQGSIPPPPHRSLQIYAFDPSLDLDLSTARVNRSVVDVAWEDDLQPGPCGEYLEIVDVDPPSQAVYEPVDLNAPRLLAQHGLSPSEGNPQFHQQMVYAVAMKTIENFEQALGRSVHWSPRIFNEQFKRLPWRESYVPRLRIYPHALREANAYYSPDKKALLFGYFNAKNTDARDGLPGGIVFSCLSHDVITHETTHAILDGIHRRLLEASNPDSLAFHEAFADLVAIFQHFTLPGVLEDQIAATRGDLSTENLLAKLAVQFGRATQRGNALRDALGDVDPATGKWMPTQPDPTKISSTFEPHARGAILVAAIFTAFLAIYQSHIADLLRLATDGRGVLAEGAIHPDLVRRLADEARKVAQRLLTICIRALDYLPPLDVTFGDYVRGLITADVNMVHNDERHYRVALIGALRDWGIYPRDIRTLSVESLLWNRPTSDEQRLLQKLLPPISMLRTMANANDLAEEGWAILERLGPELMWSSSEQGRNGEPGAASLRDVLAAGEQLMQAYLYVAPGRRSHSPAYDAATRRRNEFLRERQFTWYLHTYLIATTQEAILADAERRQLSDLLGIDFFRDAKFEVHAIRPAIRVSPNGRTKTDLVMMLTQRTIHSIHPNGESEDPLHYRFRGGATLLIDPEWGEVRYCITKKIQSRGRRWRQEAFLRARMEAEGPGARARYGLWRPDEEKIPQEPFRLLHRSSEWED